MAERLRVDIVTIQTGGRTVEISWAAAQELQARMLRFETTAALIDRFQRVGASRPVELTQSDIGPLLVVVAKWAKELGPERLPAGVGELLDVLQAMLGASS